MNMHDLLQALYDKGCLPGQTDTIFSNAAAIAFPQQDGTETVANLLMQPDANAVIITRQLTDDMDVADPLQTVSLLYISLATANSALLDRGLLGCCQLLSTDESVRVVYAAAIPLLDPAVTADLILTAIQGIKLVTPYFESIADKVALESLDDDDAFSFHTEPVVTLHPALKVTRMESAALNKWVRKTGMSMQLILNMINGCRTLDIYFVAADDSISIYINAGKANIKLDEIALADAKDTHKLVDRVRFCWNVYRAIAGYAGARITDAYDSCDDFLFELASLFW